MASCPHAAGYRAGRAENDGPTKCTWYPGTTEKSPHEHYRPYVSIIFTQSVMYCVICLLTLLFSLYMNYDVRFWV